MEIFDNTLVVIPARGGSKRIKNKNIKRIHGLPMIYWPMIELSKIFKADNILVSTDSEIVKKIVERKGLIVPFKRPESLSDDFIGTVEVVSHALDWFEKNVKTVEFVLTVYPTAVMLYFKDIIKAMNTMLKDVHCDTVMSSTNFSFPIQRAVFKNKYGYAEMFNPENYHSRSQDLIEAKHDAGQFYLSRAQIIREKKNLTNSKVKLHELDRSKVIDIDNKEDFKIAEFYLKYHKSNYIKKQWHFT